MRHAEYFKNERFSAIISMPIPVGAALTGQVEDSCTIRRERDRL